MDNIKDRRVIKIKMNRDARDASRGTFTLMYSDDSSDDFQSIKSSFTYTGSFCIVDNNDVDPFGIRISVNNKGNVITDADGEEYTNDSSGAGQGVPLRRSESMMGRRGTTAASRLMIEESLANEGDASHGSRVSSKTEMKKNMMRFSTHRLVCKLTEGSTTSVWHIESGDKSDCVEAANNAKTDLNVSWPWMGNSGKESHVAPRGVIDFVGEEDLESGAIDLKIRIPQLAASWTPPVVVLTEVGGWKLEKTWR